MPNHTHTAVASAPIPADQDDPASDTFLGVSVGANIYGAAANLVGMNNAALLGIGGSQSHTNMQPLLTLNFIIALTGVYPSRS